MKFLTFCLALLWAVQVQAVELQGKFTQGGLIFGKTSPDTRVTLDGRELRVSPEGDFVFGFGRDAPPDATLKIERPGQAAEERKLKIKPRKYRIQRIDGLPRRMVTPPKSVLDRIKRENGEIAKLRAEDRPMVHFRGTWLRPSKGTVTGVYGSQRILNGKPRRPHFGIDFAAPTGTPVIAPAGGTVVLAHKDMYYTGGTIIIDHGHGLTSAFLHLSALSVEVGQTVARGQRVGAVGATGRSTGPHLDWRINWFEHRIDPAFLLPADALN
ncbi:MAG: M23 family metallopeptidase [Rhodospirillaceae bacterium]|nr:M23 family metallopeptidase [Rhodospirillaceae bacterium]MDD9913213.1 M23 family metallopeptidase [Rhodospirillaceae bacterium]